MKTVLLNKATIGPYEIGALLGMGGMGMVYRAYQPSLERYVALKVLARTAKSSAIFDQRFVREAAIAASLEHPHIVPVYDYGSTDDLRYVAMRLLLGGTLGDRLHERREFGQPYTPAEVNRILAPLASAIDYAHSLGIVHRDIKPSNIMFDSQDRPYLVDFGIARLMDTHSGMTQTGHALGTPSYMPPEQWMGKEATSPSDVYALGAVTFEMLTLHPPFEANNPFALMQQHVQAPPPLVNDLRPDLPPLVGITVRQALQKMETDRFPTAGLFAEAFTDALGDKTSPAITFNDFQRTTSAVTELPTITPDTINLTTARPKRRRSWLALGVLLMAMLACGGYAVLGQGSLGSGLMAVLPATATATLGATSTDMPSATVNASPTIAPSPTFTPSPTATMTFTVTATEADPLNPVATSGKNTIDRPTKPAAEAATITAEATLTPTTAQSTRLAQTSTPRPTVTPSRTVPPPTNTAVPTAIPPTAVPPTAIPPTTIPPTPVPPTSPPASNGNGNGNSGSGGSGSGSGGSSGNGNGGGNGNGNGNGGG